MKNFSFFIFYSVFVCSFVLLFSGKKRADMALETWLPEELKFEGKNYLFIAGPINIDKTRK